MSKGKITEAIEYLRDHPVALRIMESKAFGLCGGDCESVELTRDEWPTHYLDEKLWGEYGDKPVRVWGCSKCRQVLRVWRERDVIG